MARPMRTVYLPGEDEFVGEAESFAYNLYQPSNIVPEAGNTDLWNEHLKYLFPDEVERSHVLNWCAWLLQNMGKKPKHALLIAGRIQGTGKSYIAEVLARIIGMHNVSPLGPSELSSTFNKWALHSKLLVIEELRVLDKQASTKRLHPLITQERIMINNKGDKTFSVDNCFGIFAMSNEDAAAKLDNTDRRYLVVRTFAEPKSEEYYRTLYATLYDPAALAAIAYELENRDLQAYDGQGRAPDTPAKTEMIEAGADAWAAWMRDNRDNPPLCYDVLSIEEIIEAMPKRLQRFGADAAVRAAVQEGPWHATTWKSAIKPDGRDSDQVRVWLTRAGSKELNRHTTIVNLYRRERAIAKAAAAARQPDFGPGGGDILD
jgi:hypothetical protein